MKNIHERSREGKIDRAQAFFSEKPVRQARPEGLTKQDFIRLMLSNQVVSSIRLANDILQTLLYSGKITQKTSSEGEIVFIPSSEARAFSNPELDNMAKKEADELFQKYSQGG